MKPGPATRGIRERPETIDDEANLGPAVLLEALVRIPSPSGQETAAVRYMQAQARADGFLVSEDEAGNFIADSGGGGRPILFVGHIDTVPGGTDVRRAGDVLWGRGSVDAKGALVAAYCAARRNMQRRIIIVGAVGEETDSRGMQALRIAETPDAIINGEPSGWDGFTIAYKGIIRGTFHAEAEPVHGGHPSPGALDRCMAWWATLRSTLDCGTGFDAVQARLDRLHGGLEGDRDEADGAFQLRLPPGNDPEATISCIRRLATDHDVQLHIDEALPAAVADARSRLAGAFRQAIRGAGGRPRILQKTGTSDFNHLAARYAGVPMVAYGPGDSSLDHAPDERIPLQDVERAVDVLAAVMKTL